MKRVVLLVVLTLLPVGALFALGGQTPVTAQSVGSGPVSRFTGSVTFNGQPAANGMVITAVINGAQCGVTTVSGGRYTIEVLAASARSLCGADNAPVTFVLGSIVAPERGVWLNGGTTTLNLSGGVFAPTPIPPQRFFGRITLNGMSVPDGLTVTATINGNTCGTTTTSGSSYSVEIVPVTQRFGCATEGSSIAFFLGGQLANERGVYRTGLNLPLDLTVGNLVATVTLSVGGGRGSFTAGDSIPICVTFSLNAPAPVSIRLTETRASGVSQVLWESPAASAPPPCRTSVAAAPAGSVTYLAEALDAGRRVAGSTRTTITIQEPPPPPPPPPPPVEASLPPVESPPAEPPSASEPSPVSNPLAAATRTLSGSVLIDGQAPPAGAIVTVYAGGSACARAVIAVPPGFIATLDADCPPGTDLSLAVTPRVGGFESGPLPIAGSLPPDSATLGALNIDLTLLAPTAGNVPLSGWTWGEQRPIAVWLGCAPPSEANLNAVLRALDWWEAGFARVGAPSPFERRNEGCPDGVSGIVVREVELPDQPGQSVTVGATTVDGAACTLGEPCALTSGELLLNSASRATPPTVDAYARLVARELGRLLGLAPARRCTGGTIMHDDPRCLFPRQSIGVDDLATLTNVGG